MSDVVGSASFELRATRDKIPADVEAARQDILAATKKTEAELAGLVGTGSAEGNKKAAASFEAPKAAANDAGNAIKASMRAASAEIASSVKAGTDKAKADLDSLAAKAREVQSVQKPWMPDEAYRKATNVPFVPVSPTPNVSAPALRETGEAAKEAAKDLDTVGNSSDLAKGKLEAIGKVSAGVIVGIAAVAGAAVIVGKVLYEMGTGAMKAGDDIANTAKKIGIGTDALQTWEFVAKKTGATAADADRALENFSTKLSQATAGTSKEAVKAFALLQIGPEQLKSFKSTEQAIDVVTDRIKSLKSEADRAAVAEALGLGPLSNALKDNAVDVAALRDEAMRLGVVMDAEMIRRASQAQGEFDGLAGIINVQLKGAFVDLAPAILTAIGLVARLATSLSDALDAWRDLDSKTARGIQRADSKQAEEQKYLIDTYGSPAQMRGQVVRARPVEGGQYSDLNARQGASVLFRGAPSTPSAQRDPSLNEFENRSRNGTSAVNAPQYVDAYEHFNALNRSRVLSARELTERAEVSRPARTDRPDGGGLTLPPPRPGRQNHSADQEARRAERVEEEIARARIRVLGIVDDEAQTVQQRFDTAKAQVEAEREAEAKNPESRKARKDITKAEFDQLTLINTQTAALEDRVANDILARDLSDERLAKERALSDLTVDLLSIQAGSARTAGERARLERQLLVMAQRRARDDLETELARTPGLSEDDKRNRRGRLADVQRAQSEAASQQNLTPLQAWRDQSLKSIDEVNEAYENIAARGLDALNDGIVDAIMNSKNLGDVFSNVAKQILADLLAISVRKGVTEPLANMLFGGEDGGGATGKVSAISSIVKSFLGSFGRRALGGPVSAGTPYVVGENRAELFIPSVPGTILPSIGGAAGGGMGRQAAPMHFDMRGAVMTADLLQQAQDMATATGGIAYTSARQAVPQDMAKKSRYSRGRS